MSNEVWPTQEQCNAFAAVLRQLFDEYPTDFDYHRINRQMVLEELANRHLMTAKMFLDVSGVPIERTQAIEALLF